MNLSKLLSLKLSFSKDDQAAIDSLALEASVIEAMEGMKKTDGWKVLGTKIREELQSRITQLVADDLKVTTLLSILSTVETKRATELLEQNIKAILPE